MGKHYDALPNNFEKALVMAGAIHQTRNRIEKGEFQQHEFKEQVEQAKEIYADKSLGHFEKLEKIPKLVDEAEMLEQVLNLAPGGQTR